MGKKKQIMEQSANISETVLSCQGQVNINLMRNGKVMKQVKIHNDPTIRLLRCITLGISSRFTVGLESEYLPKFMAIGSGDGSTTLETTHLTQIGDRSPVVSRGTEDYTETSGNVSILKGSKSVLTSSFSYEQVGGNTIKELGLFATYNNDDLLARVVLTEPISVPLGMSIYIEWSIILKGVN